MPILSNDTAFCSRKIGKSFQRRRSGASGNPDLQRSPTALVARFRGQGAVIRSAPAEPA
jgi:hypothetical protein